MEQKFLEYIGAAFGIVGALIMAITPEYAYYAWNLWLISTICLGMFAVINRLMGLATLQAVFGMINAIGIYNTMGIHI